MNNVIAQHSSSILLQLRRKARVAMTLLLCATLGLGGCVSKILESKVDEPQVYVLKVSNVAPASVAYPVQISIALPTAAPGLDTSRIAVLRNDNQLDYYFGARWGGSAPQVVQSFLIDALQTQQSFKSVVAETARVDADYLLELQLKDFQAEYASGDNPVVNVSITGTLINIKTRKSVTIVTASASVAAQDNRLGAVVTAFQRAVQQTSNTISTQLAAAAK